MSGSHEVSRRDFVKVVTGFLGAIIGGTIAIPAVGYILGPALQGQSSKEREIEAGPLENYPEGVPMLFNFNITKVNGWERTVNSYGVYVLRSGSNVTVFSNVCTHLSCRVKWHEDSQEYLCPCHDAAFSKDGGIIKGPQPRPLDTLQAEVREGGVFILFSEGKKE
jgi:Rieske Fe-S protein